MNSVISKTKFIGIENDVHLAAGGESRRCWWAVPLRPGAGGRRLRISAHAYNGAADVERALKELKALWLWPMSGNRCSMALRPHE